MARPITPAGYRRFEEELGRLWHVDRPKIVNEVSDAAAMGDRSENAEYIYGKKKLREIDRRIRQISELMDKLTVVEPKDTKSEKVQFGATVVVEDDEGVERTYQLVGEDEAEAKEGRISIASPIGKALLQKKIGDRVLVMRPAGELEIVVKQLRYE